MNSTKTKIEIIKMAQEIHLKLSKIGYSQFDIHLIAELLSSAAQAAIFHLVGEKIKEKESNEFKEKEL